MILTVKNIVKACLVFLLLIYSLSAFGQDESGNLNRSISEKYLGKIDFSSWINFSFTVSPDKRHIAYVVKRNYHMFVIVDGKEGKKYDSIWGVGINRGSSCSRKLLSGYDRMPIFSPNSKKIAYAVQKGAKQFIVVNEVESKGYDEVCEYQFSPNSKRFAYLAREDGKTFAVVDRIEGKRYDDISGFRFSSDSKMFTYLVWEKGIASIVVERHKKIEDAGNYTFSPDGRRIAYVARGDHGKEFLVIDDIKKREYDSIKEFVFSPNGRRYAYEATNDSKSFIVIDGNEWRKYLRPYYHRYRVFFSPDSKKVAFIVKEDNKEFVVMDGVELEKHYDIDEYSFTFSPNGKKFSYIAKDGNKSFLVVNGITGKKYDYISRPVFSPDGNKIAYEIQEGKKSPFKCFVVMDGIEKKKYDDVSSITFSPDSKRLAYMAQKGKKTFVVIDGNEGVQYDFVEEMRYKIYEVVFDSPEKLHYIAMKGNEIYLIEENIKH